MSFDPLLHCIQTAIERLRSQRAYETTVAACIDMLRSEAHRFSDGYLKLSTELLVAALASPTAERSRDVLEALLVCKRTILAGIP
jgi:hypothetical protein